MAKAKYEEWLTEEGLIKIAGWARDGLTDEDIAHNMGISRVTLIAWKKEHSIIDNTLKKSKEIVDRIVEGELFKKTQGYTVDLIKPMKVQHKLYNKDGKLKSVTEKYIDTIVQEFYPADTTAQIFWLKNRKVREWRDRIENTIITPEPIKIKLDVSKLTDEELKQLSNIGDKLNEKH